ncbi:LON peptidase substrate-binding domain-containing protein [Micromonospora sp. WMMD812]|uniref:LON peptidase substrate-binding domain-containing protein n=1 Tax=Micromonospora sp. WMMD812 TaxID=3015152 RepID=UPI00248CAE1D|nr:LON peptidase substrate-binding domain-containing protein [Micromonospora sp. WMMD812]WBB67290.1 LON peptidase substrate-binding domain-containing protein [Micromonospora sp. WMMD812]
MTARLPVFPLGTVLFPGLVLPLHIFEERYRALIRHLVDLPAGAPREFGVVAIQAGWEVAPTAPGGRPTAPGGEVTLHDVGCTAELRQVTELADGGFDIVTVGRRRFRIADVDERSAPYLTAEVEWLPEPGGPDEVADLLAARVIAVFRQYLGLIRADPEEISEQLPEDPTVLSHLVAATAALTVDDRQRLLAIDDTAARLRAELRLLNREAALLRQVRAVPVPLTELASPPTPN